MRLYLDQFQTLVGSTVGSAAQQPKVYPLYLLSGEDETLLSACQEQLYTYLNKQGFSGPHYESCPLAFCSAQLSLFSQKEISVHKLNKASVEFTKALVNQSIHNQKIQVILTGNLDKTQAKSKWVQYIETHGVVVSLWPPEGYKLKKWLSDTASYFQLVLSDTQKNCILENMPNNLAEIYQLLKLLAFCFAQEPITDELLYSLLQHQPQYSAQQLIEAILKGDLTSTIKISKYLCNQQKILLVIWWLNQLFDWWQLPSENKSTTPLYFSASPLKNKAQNLNKLILQTIQGNLVSWKTQLFQLDLYAKNSQTREAEYQLNQLLLSVVKAILVYA
jgi:DNA polymerase III delta subunit